MSKILLAIEDPISRQGLSQTLQEKGYQTVYVGSLAEATRQFQNQDIQVVLCDARLLANAETEFAFPAISSGKGPRLLLLARSFDDLQRAQEANKKWAGADSQIVTGAFTADALLSALAPSA